MEVCSLSKPFILVASLPEKYSLLADCLLLEPQKSPASKWGIWISLMVWPLKNNQNKGAQTVTLPPVLKILSWIESHGLRSDDYIFFTNSRNIKVEAGSRQSPLSRLTHSSGAFDWNGILGANIHSEGPDWLISTLKKMSLREIMDISGHKNLSLQQYLDTDKKLPLRSIGIVCMKECNLTRDTGGWLLVNYK